MEFCYSDMFDIKADLIDVKIGYPDYTYNETYLNSIYENV